MTESRKVVVRERIQTYAARNLAGKCGRILVRFRGALCYVDAEQKEPDGREAIGTRLGGYFFMVSRMEVLHGGQYVYQKHT